MALKVWFQSPNEEGLLEYLEDIVGSNRLIPQIENIKEELSKIAEVVGDVIQLLHFFVSGGRET